MQDIRQTEEYANYLKSLGWIVEKRNGINYFIRKLWFFGSVIKIQRPKRISYKDIEYLCKKYRAFQIILEPCRDTHGQELVANGFVLNRNYFSPSKSLQINLAGSEKQLLSKMHHKTRYNIKKSAHHTLLTTHCTKDVLSFADFWQSCASAQRGMYLSQKKEIVALYRAFGKKAHIIEVHTRRVNNVRTSRILSAILLICTKRSAHYMFAASTTEGKRFFAPTINAWEAIKYAKKIGCKLFDFEGIYDERFPVTSWQGFTRFKKSFGGKEIKYPGCYSRLRIPF